MSGLLWAAGSRSFLSGSLASEDGCGRKEHRQGPWLPPHPSGGLEIGWEVSEAQGEGGEVEYH